MAAAGPGGSADKASKVKSLLASYYDLDDAGGEPSPSLYDTPRTAPSPGATQRSLAPSLAGASASADVAALNASYFDPDAYLKRVLKETRLADLAALQRDMLGEVGGLDSDMQMLVYENYNKFIAATDTIKLMSASMEGMDDRMASLRTLIDGVVATSETVNGKLQQRQEEVEELNAVRALLAKLQAVFDLPRKLRAAIDQGAYEVAADCYADAAPLLKKYGHKGAFKRVAADVEALGHELAGLLRKRLLAAPDQAAECIAMIAKLGEPTESLQEDFLECKRQRLEGLLAAAGLMLKTLAVDRGLLSPAELGSVDEGLRRRMLEMFRPAGEPAAPLSGSAAILGGGGGGQAPLPSLHAVIVELDGRFITEITHTAALFAELFPPGGRKRLVKMVRECFARYLKLTRRALSDASAIAAATAAGITTSGELVQPLEEALRAAELAAEEEAQGYGAGGAPSALDQSIAADWGTAGLLQGLYVVKTDLVRLDTLLPELSPRDRGAELVEHTVRQHVSLCFAALERRLLATAEALAAELAAPDCRRNGAAKQRTMAQGLAVLQALLVQGVERLLRSLKEYERQAWVLAGWQEVFVNAVHGQLQNLFLSLCQQLLAAAALAAPPSLSAAVVGSARSTVESAAPFAAVQRRRTLSLPEGSSSVLSGSGSVMGGSGSGHSSSGSGPAGGGGGDPAAGPPPALRLLLCHLCKFAEREAVGLALVLLQQLYPERLLAGGEELPAFQPTELGRQLGATAGALLQGYVDAHGASLAAAADASTASTDWAAAREPRAPRPVCDTFLEKAADVDVEACYLLAPADRDSGTASRLSCGHSRAPSAASAASWDSSVLGGTQQQHGSRAGGAAEAGGQGSFVEASVSRMLASGRDRGGWGGGGLELSRPSIAAGVLSVGLRALVEGLRRQTLGRGAFQQIQLDVHYLRPELQRLVAGASAGPAAVQLLDELMAVAMECCTEPLLVDSSVLDRVLAAAAAAKQAGGGGGQPSMSLL